MTTTTTRGRPGREATTRRAPRQYVDPQRTGAYVDGANALQIGYAEPMAPPAPKPVAPPRRKEETRRPVGAATGSAPLPIALPRAPFLVLVVSIVVVGVLGVLVLNTRINENAFRLDSLRQQQSALDQQEQALNRELAQRESPGELRAAAARLGLVPAGTPAFINLPDGRVVGVPQPASGTSATGQ
jgi:hypothetical protein